LVKDLGYPIDRHPRLYFFDALPPSFTGYVSIGFYGNGHPIHHFEINEKTGQVVDSVVCEIYDFPDLRVFQRTQQQLSGSRAMTTEELMDEIGCQKLKVVRSSVAPSQRRQGNGAAGRSQWSVLLRQRTGWNRTGPIFGNGCPGTIIQDGMPKQSRIFWIALCALIRPTKQRFLPFETWHDIVQHLVIMEVIMQAISYSKARHDLKNVMDDACSNHERDQNKQAFRHFLLLRTLFLWMITRKAGMTAKSTELYVVNIISSREGFFKDLYLT